MLYKTHRRTSDNTMAKTNKDKQCYTKHIEERQTIPWPKPTRRNNVMVLSDVLRCVLYNIVCPCWFWSWYCLTFFDVFCITLFVLVGFGYVIEPTKTSNVIQNTSKNVRQYHGQTQQTQTMLYKTHGRTSDNTMAVCPCWFWLWYCLTFFDVFHITLFVLVGFGYGIV
jgi:hypothetical protein